MLATLVALAAGAAEKKSGLPQLNVQDFAPQLIWLALTFGFMFFVLSRVALPRIGEVIEARRDRIQRDLDEAERLKRETEKALAAYEQALTEARAKAGSIAKENRDRVGSEIDAQRAKVESQISAKIVDAEARIATVKTQALAGVNEIATSTAGAIVEKLIGQSVGPGEISAALAKSQGR